MKSIFKLKNKNQTIYYKQIKNHKIMKKTILSFLVLGIVCLIKVNAQNYLINFTGSGAANTVDSVKVQNLTQNTSLSLSGSDILELIVSVGIKEINSTDDNLKIYPNPMQGQAELSFYAKQAGNTHVLISDITGKEVVQINKNSAKGINKYKIADLKQGIYYINIIGENFFYTAKLISINTNQNETKLEYLGNDNNKELIPQQKGTNSIFSMNYTIGDLLLFKGYKGNYITNTTYVPNANTNIDFNFTSCTDYDNNNYSNVKIGNQIWMAENLKTTHYKNGTPIPNVTNYTTWGDLTTGAFCDYNDTMVNSATYGRIYNWYAVNTGNLCPIGWHVPSYTEFITLINYLGGNSIAGGKLKATTLWYSPNTGATNETGFTALPGGSLYFDGLFYNSIGYSCAWWIISSPNFWGGDSWGLDTDLSKIVYGWDFYPNRGFSVRCVKD